MAKWWKFGLGKKGEGKKETPAPTPAPTPTPTPAPKAEAPAPEPAKKKGLFGRIKDKVSRKPKEAPPEAPPAAPPAPPGPPAPPAPPVGGPAEGGGEEGEEEALPETLYPSSVSVTVDGTWAISDSVWHGLISGTLSGADAKAFLIHLEKNNDASAVALVARAYDSQDMGFARYLSLKDSTWGPINWS